MAGRVNRSETSARISSDNELDSHRSGLYRVHGGSRRSRSPAPGGGRPGKADGIDIAVAALAARRQWTARRRSLRNRSCICGGRRSRCLWQEWRELLQDHCVMSCVAVCISFDARSARARRNRNTAEQECGATERRAADEDEEREGGRTHGPHQAQRLRTRDRCPARVSCGAATGDVRSAGAGTERRGRTTTAQAGPCTATRSSTAARRSSPASPRSRAMPGPGRA
jgi:hypothetical protein